MTDTGKKVKLKVTKPYSDDNIYETLIRKVITNVFSKAEDIDELDTYDMLSAEVINLALASKTLYSKLGPATDLGGPDFIGEIISLVRIGLSLGLAIRDNELAVILEEVIEEKGELLN